MAITLHSSFAVHPGEWLSADTLLRMQAAHDLATARVHERDIRVERIAA